jgi:plastocyanin
MKKHTITLSFMILAAFLVSFQGFSVKHTILVGNYFFNPSTLNGVDAGDTIRWEWQTGNHTTTSTSIPAGASSWDHPLNSSNQVYEYVPVVGGTYNFKCTPHAGMGMVGSFVVTAAAPLTVDASAEDSQLCMGQSTFLHAVAAGGTGSYTYSWISNPPGFTSNLANVQVTPTQTTTYTVTASSGGQTAASSVTVTVQNPPAVIAGPDTTYCDNVNSFPVTATASDYSSVNWTTTGDGTFNTGNTLNDTYNPGTNDLSGGSVDLIFQAMAVAPCLTSAKDTVHVTFVLCTGIGNEKSNKVWLTVYPNPSSGQFTLQTGSLPETATLKIFDMQGRIVHEEILQPSVAGVSTAVNISGLPSGVYQLNVLSGKTTGTARVLVR